MTRLRLIATATLTLAVLALVAWDAHLVWRRPALSPITAEEFDRAVFGAGVSPAAMRSRMNARLDQDLENLETSGVLTADELDRLRAGGERDFERWFRDVDARRSRVVGRPFGAKERAAELEQLEQLRLAWQSVLYEPGSNYRRAIDRDTWARIDTARREAVERAQQARRIAVVVGENGERWYSVSAEAFDTMVFGGDLVVELIRNDLNRRLDQELRMLDERCRLTDGQREKLRLAARGDFKEWLDRVVALRADLTAELIDADLFDRDIRPQIGLMQEQHRRLPIRPQSLFLKTLNHVLSAEQRLEAVRLDRELARNFVDGFLRVNTQLSDDLRQQVTNRLVESCPMGALTGPYPDGILLLQLETLADELHPLIGEESWDALMRIRHARGTTDFMTKLALWPMVPPDADP